MIAALLAIALAAQPAKTATCRVSTSPCVGAGTRPLLPARPIDVPQPLFPKHRALRG